MFSKLELLLLLGVLVEEVVDSGEGFFWFVDVVVVVVVVINDGSSAGRQCLPISVFDGLIHISGCVGLRWKTRTMVIDVVIWICEGIVHQHGARHAHGGNGRIFVGAVVSAVAVVTDLSIPTSDSNISFVLLVLLIDTSGTAVRMPQSGNRRRRHAHGRQAGRTLLDPCRVTVVIAAAGTSTGTRSISGAAPSDATLRVGCDFFGTHGVVDSPGGTTMM
mmetsp:Transcript_2020/g.4122  ORF Transcript_2020/g.4122 Transcript_2020/m.4122 type:complete len:219 (-) Transcript_2020:368-1024(-)